MADAAYLEKEGIPTVVVGMDKLTDTVGKVTAQAQGLSGYMFAAYTELIGSGADDKVIERDVEAVLPQVEVILTGGS